jgi:nicotinamidase-related amidase
MLSAHDSFLLIVDMQTRLLPAISGHQRLLEQAERMARAARLLAVPVVATEHCADKIGATAPSLLPHIDLTLSKTSFDATQETGLTSQFPHGRTKVLLMGTEAHVCVLQTGLGLAAAGYAPVLVVDCVGSRRMSDLDAARERWRHQGLEAVTSEMALFEWLGSARHPEFKNVLALIKGNGGDTDTSVS